MRRHFGVNKLLTEIKLLTKSKDEEPLKKKKDEFRSAFTQLSKRIIKLVMKKTTLNNVVDAFV